MKKMIWIIYSLLVLGIAGADLILDTAAPVELVDVIFSIFKGVTLGTAVMVIILLAYYLYKKISYRK